MCDLSLSVAAFPWLSNPSLADLKASWASLCAALLPSTITHYFYTTKTSPTDANLPEILSPALWRVQDTRGKNYLPYHRRWYPCGYTEKATSTAWRLHHSQSQTPGDIRSRPLTAGINKNKEPFHLLFDIWTLANILDFHVHVTVVFWAFIPHPPPPAFFFLLFITTSQYYWLSQISTPCHNVEVYTSWHHWKAACSLFWKEKLQGGEKKGKKKKETESGAGSICELERSILVSELCHSMQPSTPLNLPLIGFIQRGLQVCLESACPGAPSLLLITIHLLLALAHRRIPALLWCPLALMLAWIHLPGDAANELGFCKACPFLSLDCRSLGKGPCCLPIAFVGPGSCD